MPVRSISALLATALALTAGSLVPSPTYAAALTAPDGLTSLGDNDAGYPVLSWVPVSGATSYEVVVDDDPAFATPTVTATTVNISYVASTAMPPGTQSWRVRAVATGAQSAWATSQVDVPRTAAPVPSAPADGVALPQPEEAPLLEWSVVPGSTTYVVQVDDEPGFVQPKEFTTRATSLVVDDPLAPAQPWYWRVKAVRGAGIESFYSGHRSFRIGALAVPEVVGPDSSPTNDLTDVVLDWRPVPGARYYDLEVSTDDDFATSTIVDTRTKLTATRYSPAVTYDNNQYFWRVRAVSSDTTVKSAWSASTNQFRRSWPDQPELVYPAPDATAVGDPFFYEWSPVAHATYYQVQISDSPLFDTKVSTCSTAGTTYTPGAFVQRDVLAAPGLTKDVTGCKPFSTGTTYWRVRAFDRPRNPGVQGLFSEAQRFGYLPSPSPTGTFGPVTGQRIALTGTATGSASCTGGYAAGAPVVSICADLPSTPVFTWDAVPEATFYTVYVSNDDKFTNVLEYASTRSTMWTPSMAAVHPAVPESQAGASYFWFVRPCRTTAACGSASPISVTPSMATNVFRKRSPGIAGGVASPGTGDDTEVTFSWDDYADTNATTTWHGAGRGSTSHQTAQSYRVEVSATASFATLLDSAIVDQTTYTSPTKLYPDGTVHWRVRAIDAADNDLAWSPTWSWSKTGPAVRLLSPADGAEIASSVPLQWDALPHAQAYDVQVASDDDPTFSLDHLLFTERTTQTAFTWDKVVPVDDLAYVWRVRRVDSFGNLGAWSTVRRFSNPPVQLTLRAPTQDENVPAARALFTWDFVPGATSYRVEISQGTRTTTWSTTGNAYAPPAAFSTGSRQWRVVAFDAARDQVGTSELQTFRVEALGVVEPTAIEGSGEVGTQVVAVEPVFDPEADTVAYQWFRASSPGATPTSGATPIVGATGPAYTVAAADLGAHLLVRATGSRDGYPDGATISPALLVGAGGAPVVITAPTITGPARVGELLTTVAGTWSGAPSLAYQWFRDGAPIQGATTSTYRLVAADLGRAIHVVETASTPGRLPATAASTSVVPTTGSSPVALTAPQMVAAAAVTAGDTVSVRNGTWSPATGVTFAYRWLRDDVPIDGATGSSYQLTAADVGRSVRVVVTASAAGRDSSEATTPAVVPNGAITASERPAIAGEAVSGHTLTAAPGRWPTTVQTRYQWYADGVAVTQPSTSPTYSLRPADVGRAVSVRVLATASGYLPGSADSPPVDVRSEGPIANLQRPTITGTATPGSTLRVSPGSWSTDATLAVQWFRDQTPITGATGTSYAVTAADAGRRIAVVITATAEHWDQTIAASIPVTVAKAGSSTALTLSAARTTAKRPVVATIVVRSLAAATGGTVTMYDGTRRLGSVRLTSPRTTYKLPRLAAGTHTIKAVYSGTVQVAGSVTSTRLVVVRG